MHTLQKYSNQILYGMTVLAVLMIMSPRLLSAQFGLLDDGVTILHSKQILTGDLVHAFDSMIPVGRMMPAYLFFNAWIYWLAGPNALGFFFLNFVTLATITIILVLVVWSWTASRLQACLTGVLFVFSVPVIENFYTLSKPEVPQSIGLIAILGLLYVTRQYTSWRRLVAVISLVMAVTSAEWSKEPAVVLIPIGFAWLIHGWLRQKYTGENCEVSTRINFALAGIIALGIFTFTYFFFIPSGLAGGSYSQRYSLDFVGLLAHGRMLAGFFLVGFAFILPPLLFVLIFDWISLHRLPRILWVDAGIWMLGWGCIFLPWPAISWYHLLPFTMGAVSLGAMAIGQTINILQRSLISVRIIAWVSLILAFLLYLPGFFNSISNMQTQLVVDRANAQLVEKLALLPPNSRILFNQPADAEYIGEVGVHLNEFKQRTDIQVQALSDRLPELGSMPTYIVSPKIENTMFLPVRIGVTENMVLEGEGLLKKQAAKVEKDSIMANAIIFNPGLYQCLIGKTRYCQKERMPFAIENFSYGWMIYQVD